MDQDLIAVATFNHLQSRTVYYVRACVQAPKMYMPGPQAHFFARGKFQTLPEQDETVPIKLAIVGSPLFAKGHKLGGMVGQNACWKVRGWSLG